MSPDLEQKIFALKPEWFKNLYSVECGDGWFDLIYVLVEKLIHLASEEPMGFVDFSVAQIKEKFGGLRFYVNYGESYESVLKRITTLIEATEHIAWKTCELCGKQARLRTIGYVQTLCRYPHDHAEG